MATAGSGAGSSSQRRLAPSGSEGYDPDVEQVGCCTRGWTIALDEGFSKYSKAPVYVLILGILSMLLCGYLIIGTAGWALRHQGTYTKLVPNTGFNLIIAAGFAIVTIATIGAYGALGRSRFVLRLFAGLITILILFELVAAIVTVAWLGDSDTTYKSKLLAGGAGYTEFEQGIDEALNTTWTACCKQAEPVVWSKHRECTFLDSANDITPADCDGSEAAFKVKIVDYVAQKIVRPVAIVSFVAIIPQLATAIAIYWLVCHLAPRDKSIKDDLDPTLAPIRYRDEELYKRTLEFDDDGTPLTEEELLLAQDEPEPDEFPWCYVLVFPCKEDNPAYQKNSKGARLKQKGYRMEDVIKRLKTAGLLVELHQSRDKSEIFVYISATNDRLKLEANRVDYLMRLDTKLLKEADLEFNKENRNSELVNKQARDATGDPRAKVIQDEITDTVAGSHWGPYTFIYGKYDIPADPDEYQKKAQRLFRRDRATRSMFWQIDVIVLVKSIIEGSDTLSPKGANLDLDKMYNAKCLSEYFPLRDLHARDRLKSLWFVWFNHLWELPLNQIRHYLGAKIALYAAFISHYTKWLMGPGLVGLAVYIHQLSAGSFSVATLPLYGIFIAVWATAMLEYWKRTEKFHAKEWGMSTYEQEEITRPEFNNHPLVKLVPSPVSAMPVQYFPPKIRRNRYIVSWTMIIIMIFIVLVCVFSIMVLRLFLVKLEDEGTIPVGAAGAITAIVNALQIQILNVIYQRVAVWLNDKENHETDTEYEDNKILKVFAFQFINSYFSLFYIAFIKNHLELFGRKQPCRANVDGEPDCLAELAYQLGIIFVSRLVAGNFTEAILPALKIWWNGRKEDELLKKESRDGVPVSPAEIENELDDYETFSDYAELVIQFGYVSLFVVAFPLAPMLALVSNWVEMRVDAYKLLHNCCRPDPAGAQDIGTWYKWLVLMGNIAVVTNLATILFASTSNAFAIQWVIDNPVWTFVILEHAVFLIKLIFDWAVPDLPAMVKLQIEREAYFVNKHLKFIDDDVIADKDTKPEAAIGEVELEFDSSSSDDEGAGGGAGAGAGAGSTNAAAVTPIGVDDGDGTDSAGPHVDTAGTPRSLTSPRVTNRGPGTPKTPKIRVGDYDPTKFAVSWYDMSKPRDPPGLLQVKVSKKMN